MISVWVVSNYEAGVNNYEAPLPPPLQPPRGLATYLVSLDSEYFVCPVQVIFTFDDLMQTAQCFACHQLDSRRESLTCACKTTCLVVLYVPRTVFLYLLLPRFDTQDRP